MISGWRDSFHLNPNRWTVVLGLQAYCFVYLAPHGSSSADSHTQFPQKQFFGWGIWSSSKPRLYIIGGFRLGPLFWERLGAARASDPSLFLSIFETTTLTVTYGRRIKQIAETFSFVYRGAE